MSRLEPRQIEVFQAVVETGSATLAAERLRMTQSNVTRAIANLEAKTGLGLFERGRFGMRLTTVGDQFAQEVTRSFAGLNRIAAVADSLRQGLRGRIVVAAYPIHAEGVVAEVLGGFSREAPELSVRIDALGTEEIIRRVLHDEAQIGVLPGPIASHAQLHSRVLADRRMLAVVRPGHPLASQASVTVPDLGASEIIHYSPLAGFRSVIDQAFARMTTPVRHRIEVMTQRGAMKMALRSDAVALVDEDAVREMIDQYPELRALPIDDGPAWQICMLWSRDHAPTPVTVNLLERLTRAFSSPL